MVNLVVYERDIWFQGRRAVEGVHPPCSGQRRFRTISKARRAARGIIDRWPGAVVEIGRFRGGVYKFETWSRPCPE
jgi:hypothetical protein